MSARPAAGDAGGARSSRLAAAWGHHAPEVLCTCIVAAIVIALRPPPGLLMLTVPLALVTVVLASWLFMRRHDRRLCELCVAAMPLDAAARAVRYRRRFLLAHSASRPALLVPYLAVLVGTNALPGTWGRIVWALAQSTMIYLITSHVTHRRFQPWCPWCSDGGGGEHHEDEPTAPPPPSDRRVLL